MTESVEQHRITELEKDVDRLYTRIHEMEASYRKHMEELDKKYVRLERYVTVERIVYAFIAGIVVAVGGLVFTVLTAGG